MVFVDTNYFIRFLVGDVEWQHEQARELFERGAIGEVDLVSSTIVFFEIFWVFVSFYEKSRNEVIEILQKVLSMSYVDFSEREVLEKALDLYEESNLELEDCYNLVYAKKEGVEEMVSFDKKLAGYWERLVK